MKKGDKFLVTGGEYRGMILTVRTIIDDTVYPMEDLENGATIAFPPFEYREWTPKDKKVKTKFHKLLQTISDNKTTLIARAARDTDDMFIRNLIDMHHDNMILVTKIYDRFLFKRVLSKLDIKKLNEIWRNEYKSIEFYANGKWVYDKSLPHNFSSKFTDENIATSWRLIVSLVSFYENKAYAVMYNGT